jgi:hypothetical protein
LRAATKAEQSAAPVVSPPVNSQPGFAEAIGANPLVWMARANHDDIAPRFLSLIDNSLLAFFSAIVDTARNGHENELMLLPGYRDRIVHVATTPVEGGLNLQMKPQTIQELSDRGRDAADLLISRFDPQGSASRAGFRLNWQNHRWIRFRSTMAALERFLADFSRGWHAPSVSGESFKSDSAKWDPTNFQNARTVAPGHRVTPSYPWANSSAAIVAGTSTDAVIALAEQIRGEAQSLSTSSSSQAISVFDGLFSGGRSRAGAPRPKMVLKMRPSGGDPKNSITYQ